MMAPEFSMSPQYIGKEVITLIMAISSSKQEIPNRTLNKFRSNRQISTKNNRNSLNPAMQCTHKRNLWKVPSLINITKIENSPRDQKSTKFPNIHR